MTDKMTQENFLSSNMESDEIDLGKIFRFLLMQSKLILSISIVVFILAFANYYFSTKKYQIQSLLQYEAFDQNIFDPSKALQMASSNTSSDISNLTELYESRTNYLKVIKDLNLNISIKDLNDFENIDIKITSNNDNLLQTHKLKFSFSENGYSLLDNDLNEIQTTKYGEPIQFNDLEILINS